MSTSGRPSADGRITLYTKDECSALGGNWHENGECLKKSGGSFSWDNRPTKEKQQEPLTVKIQLQDTTITYTNVKSVTIMDQSGNTVYPNEIATSFLKSEEKPE